MIYYKDGKKTKFLRCKFSLLQRLLFLLFAIAILSKSYASVPSKTGVSALESIHSIEDKQHSLTIRSVIENQLTLPFKPFVNNQNYGFKNSAFWLKIEVQNNLAFTNTYLISILYPLMNEVSYYETCNGVILDSIITGELYPHTSRRINDRNFVFRFNVQNSGKKTIFIRLYNSGETIRIPLLLENLSEKKSYGNTETFQRSIYYGYILFALAFNLFMIIGFNKKQNFLLSIYILGMSLFLFVLDGYAFQYFWPQLPYFSNHTLVLFSLMACISILFFSDEFLQNIGIAKKISRTLSFISFLYIVWSFIPSPFEKYTLLGANLFIFVLILFVLILSFMTYKKHKTQYNLVFFMSFVWIIASVIIYIFRNLGLLPVSDFTNYSLKVGLAFQITHLTFATVIQFRDFQRNTNKYLEEMVTKRTNQITIQNKQLRNQNNQIESHYNEIRQSITYAKRIQNAVLPENEEFSSVFKNFFILYKPKDIVSGDFYWIAKKNNKIYIVAADCTGHGVPGGFLSMLGISFLNQIVLTNENIRPNEVLKQLSDLISKTINSDHETISHDSMDISICVIDLAQANLEFSAANNSLYIVRDSDVIELKSESKSLQNDHQVKHQRFSNYEFALQEQDKMYLFSDGFCDQFGGINNRRFSKRKFKTLLLQSSKSTMKEQQLILEDSLHSWRGSNQQTDDILVLGIELQSLFS